MNDEAPSLASSGPRPARPPWPGWKTQVATGLLGGTTLALATAGGLPAWGPVATGAVFIAALVIPWAAAGAVFASLKAKGRGAFGRRAFAWLALLCVYGGGLLLLDATGRLSVEGVRLGAQRAEALLRGEPLEAMAPPPPAATAGARAGNATSAPPCGETVTFVVGKNAHADDATQPSIIPCAEGPNAAAWDEWSTLPSRVEDPEAKKCEALAADKAWLAGYRARRKAQQKPPDDECVALAQQGCNSRDQIDCWARSTSERRLVRMLEIWTARARRRPTPEEFGACLNRAELLYPENLPVISGTLASIDPAMQALREARDASSDPLFQAAALAFARQQRTERRELRAGDLTAAERTLAMKLTEADELHPVRLAALSQDLERRALRTLARARPGGALSWEHIHNWYRGAADGPHFEPFLSRAPQALSICASQREVALKEGLCKSITETAKNLAFAPAASTRAAAAAAAAYVATHNRGPKSARCAALASPPADPASETAR